MCLDSTELSKERDTPWRKVKGKERMLSEGLRE